MYSGCLNFINLRKNISVNDCTIIGKPCIIMPDMKYSAAFDKKQQRRITGQKGKRIEKWAVFLA
jgi:hypothetical protein